MLKKLLIVFILAVFILIPFVVYAAPVGNVAKPAMLKSLAISKDIEDAKFGVIGEGEFDLTFDRKIKDDEDEAIFYFAGGKLGIVFMDRYMLYGLLGTAYYEEETIDEGSKIKIESEIDLAWGFGATLILYEDTIIQVDDGMLRLGIDGRFRTTEMDIDKIIIDGTEYSIPSGSVTDMSFEYDDWQVAAVASLEWKKWLIPYCGIKYSTLDGTFKATVAGTTYEDSDIEPEKNIGIFAGMDILVFDSVSFNIEGRLIDEEAISLGCLVRF